MRIAVIGSGIAGLASAWLLSRGHEVTLYEAQNHFGGHTHTHDITFDGQQYAVDTGFIIHNPVHYPLLTRFFAELGVASQPADMSFSVHNEATGLEYNATSINALFCQRRNLVSPRFIGMVRDLLRFYRQAPRVLEGPQSGLESETGPGPTLGEWLDENGYGAAFRDEHLVPMAAALWSSPPSEVLAFPMRYLVQFMANHQLLQVSGRPQWCAVRGGSASYVRALRERWPVRERLNTPVTGVTRAEDGVIVTSEGERETFDHVVLACHSDQALALLADASPQERVILGAIAYQPNEVVLHTDASLLPRRRKAWAAWNAFIPAAGGENCTVSYCMNLLQSLVSREPFVVTLNRSHAIDPAKVLRRMHYHHPIYSHASVAAQRRKAEIQGVNRTWFGGAYWGWGFHEDGIRSAVDVAGKLGICWGAGAAGRAENGGSQAGGVAVAVAA